MKKLCGEVCTDMEKPRRLAEKPRVSTCVFADRVAACVVEECRRLGALPQQNEQTGVANTVIAAFVAVDGGGGGGGGAGVEDDNDVTDVRQTHPQEEHVQPKQRRRQMRVVALGKGTKVCSHRVISANTDGCRVHDLHAEVLARRSLMRVLYREILAGGGHLLERLPQTSAERGSCRDTMSASSASFRWRRDVSLHMYISSAPCGNATLKRWAKSRKEIFLDTLDAWTWPRDSLPAVPVQLEHDKRNMYGDESARRRCVNQNHDGDEFMAFAAREGQVAALVKRDPDVALMKKHLDISGTRHDKDGRDVKNDQDDALRSKLEELRREYQQSPLASSGTGAATSESLSAILNNRNIVPSGTSIPGLREGCMLTCSDKIAVWNCLGLQGALLARFIAEPVIVDTITVGRKFSQAHMRRAVCCRMSAFNELVTQIPDPRLQQHRAGGEGAGEEDVVAAELQRQKEALRVNHPTLMCTNVMLDEGEVDRDAPANFEAACSETWADGDGTHMEVIDAGTGMVIAGPSGERIAAGVSKRRLFDSYIQVLDAMGAPMLRMVPESTVSELSSSSSFSSFIAEYIAEKRAAAAWHHDARGLIHSSRNKLFQPGKGWPQDGFARKQDYFWKPSTVCERVPS